MSRNGTGTYTVPNTFTAGTTITASDQNENWTDIGAEMSNSVAADGQTSMTGPLKAAAGTAALPSLTFATDADTGFFRKASNTIGIAVGGAEVGSISSSGLSITFVDGSVTTAEIADSAVTTAKIADSNVTTAKIADSNVTTAKIADSNVTTAKIADSNVTTAKIADGNVTTAKLSSTLQTPIALIMGQLLHVRDEKASGTGGGTGSNSTWQTRVLNTTVTNEISSASLSSNQVSLPAGTYYAKARSPYNNANANHKARLRNVTDGSTLLVGSSAYNSAGSQQTDSLVEGRFTLSGTKTVELQHWTTSNPTNSLGLPVSSGEVEVYAELMIWKVG